MTSFPASRQSHFPHGVTGNDIMCNKVLVFNMSISQDRQQTAKVKVALEHAFCVMQRLYNLLEGTTV